MSGKIQHTRTRTQINYCIVLPLLPEINYFVVTLQPHLGLLYIEEDFMQKMCTV